MSAEMSRRRKQREEDLARELRLDLELEAEEQRERGLSGADARHAARRAFGNPGLIQEEVRTMWRWAAVERFLRDVKYAARSLWRDRSFTAVALLTLSLGIGATAAIFTVVDGVLLRPLPYPHAGRLFSVQEQGPGFGNPTSYPEVEDWRAQNRVFSDMASYHGGAFTVTGANGATHVDGLVSSANLFHALGVSPALGSGFGPDDDRKGSRVAVISDRLWREQFHSDPQIAGRSVKIDGERFTVAGVMPAGFRFPPDYYDGDLWTTSAVDQGPPRVQRGYSFLSVVARLKPGLNGEQAQAEMNVIARRLAARYPDTNKHRTSIVTVPELERYVGESRRALIILFGVAAGVLLIACVNLANLSLARNLARSREIAIRAALGAGRKLLVAQLLTESVLVSLAGGCLGVALAQWSTGALLTAIPDAVPRARDIAVDWRVLLFAVALSVTTGILFGMIPAWQISMPGVDDALKQNRQSVTEGGARRRLRDLLVAAECALAVMLLAGAGLLIASYLRLMRVDAGFDPHNLLAFSFNMHQPYTPEEQLRFFDEFQSRLKALPQVKSAVAAWPVPFSFAPSSGVEIEGKAYAPGEIPSERVHVVSPDYFHALGMQIRKGRDFTQHDTMTSAPVIAIDEAFARKYFPNENPIGKRIRPSLAMTDPAPWREIVAVVSNTRVEPAEAFHPQYYIPHAQLPGPLPAIIVKTAGDPAALEETIRRVAASIDKEAPVFGFENMNRVMADATARQRLNTLLFGVFGGLGLLLAAVGIYGVASYSVNRSRQELGIRMALGAHARDVLKLTLLRTLRWVAGGLAVGFGLTLWLTQLLESLLYGVQPNDPLTLAAACGLLIMVALLAGYLPARRATRIDPVIALRWD